MHERMENNTSPYMDVALLFLEFEQQRIHIWIHGVVNIRVVWNDELHCNTDKPLTG